MAEVFQEYRSREIEFQHLKYSVPGVSEIDKPDFATVLVDGKIEAVQLRARKSDHLSSMVNIGIGQSMAPTLLPGDRTELRKIDTVPPLGSIVTFLVGDQLVTHRVIRTEGNRFWARGDNSDAVQGPVGMEDVVGRVVAVVRDGKRIDLTGERERWLGLLRNHSMAALRDLGRRAPGLRRFIEIDLLASRPVRAAQRLLTRALFGEVTATEVPEKITILSRLLSPAWPANEKALRWLERKLNTGKISAFAASFTRRPAPVGSVVLIEDSYKATGKIGYVGWLLVQFGFRGAGIGRLLLKDLEAAALGRGLKLLWAEVAPDNVRSLGLFRALGYRELSRAEIQRWPKTLRDRLLPGRVVLGKALG